MVLECSAGDVFTLSGGSYGNVANLLAFVADDKTNLGAETANVTVDEKVITAPANAKYLFINWYFGTEMPGNIVKVYKNELLKNTVNEFIVSTNSTLDHIESLTPSPLLLHWEHGGIDNETGELNNNGSTSRSRDANKYQSDNIVVKNNAPSTLWFIYYTKSEDNYTFHHSTAVISGSTAQAESGYYLSFDYRGGISSAELITATKPSNIVYAVTQLLSEVDYENELQWTEGKYTNENGELRTNNLIDTSGKLYLKSSLLHLKTNEFNESPWQVICIFYDGGDNIVGVVKNTGSTYAYESDISVPSSAIYAIFNCRHAKLDEFSATDNGSLNDWIKRIADESGTDTNKLIPALFNSSYYTGAEIYNSAKIKEYATALYNSGVGESFVFFTDIHTITRQTGWESKYWRTLTAIQKVYNNSGAKFIMSGGDWFSYSGNYDLVSSEMMMVYSTMKTMFTDGYNIIGNHELFMLNPQGTAVELESGSQILTNCLCGGNKPYYSFDGANSKIYALDCGSDHVTTINTYRYEQLKWYANALKTDDAEHSLTFAHFYWISEDNINFEVHPFATIYANIIRAYNSKSSITVDGETFDFSNCTGKMECVLCGHLHIDKNDNDDGVNVIATATAQNESNGFPTFDCVMADYTNNVMRMVRYGTGSSRTINLT
jgi:hypothetical protein